jgi:RNA polymerase sigma factor (sigma-70 family)
MEFEEAARRHQGRVYTFARYFLGNREEAEDVTQEVLLRLWRHGLELEDEAVRPWLLRVTRNACYDQLRRRRLPLNSPAGLEALPAETAGAEADPESRAASAALSRRLRAELDRLEEPYKSVLILREIQELQYQEISDALEIPLNTVRVYIHRGRRRLREQLKEVVGDAALR